MIDFHSHILPNLDDGIRTYDDAIRVLQEAKKAGFTKIIATTHYYQDEYTHSEQERKKVIENIKKLSTGIEIILGSEIYINSQIDELIKNKQASTINNTKYILFETPLEHQYPELRNTLINLISKGYYLILAHPERYTYVQENPKTIEELLNLGIYMQANYLSIDGKYGKQAKKTVELLLKHNMISFLGTDIHTKNNYYPNIKRASNDIINLIGEQKFKELTMSNAEIILKNEKLQIPNYTKIQKGFLGKYK